MTTSCTKTVVSACAHTHRHTYTHTHTHTQTHTYTHTHTHTDDFIDVIVGNRVYLKCLYVSKSVPLSSTLSSALPVVVSIPVGHLCAHNTIYFIYNLQFQLCSYASWLSWSRLHAGLFVSDSLPILTEDCSMMGMKLKIGGVVWVNLP